ncbi:hypothetical protein CSPX01_08395 [Colletotrichum filicis]|nr:hypothetical protein CSPX01_08395 [Colletotrichum filicis]
MRLGKTLSKEAAWAVAAQRCSTEQSRAAEVRRWPYLSIGSSRSRHANTGRAVDLLRNEKHRKDKQHQHQHAAARGTPIDGPPPPSSHLPHHTDRDFLARTEAPSLPFAPLSSSPAVTDEQQQSLSAFELNFCHLHPPPPKLPSTTPPTTTQHRNSLVR